MKVRLREQYAGPSGCINPGGIGVFSDTEGRALVAGGYGEEIPEAAAPGGQREKVPEAAVTVPSEPASPEGEPGPDEAAVTGPTENTSIRRGRGGRGRGRSN